MGKTVSFTGHRPNKLKGYNPRDNKELLWKLHEEIVKHIEDKNADTFISGMALGVDMWAARIVLRLKSLEYPHLKLICAIPCLNHSSKWNAQSQKEWQSIVDKADEVFYVSKEEYKPYLMQRRNIWMVDESDYVIAVWDGSAGGTGNCVRYAQEEDKEITVINP